MAYESPATTMMAVLLIVGIVVGAGLGYLMAPTRVETVEVIAGTSTDSGVVTREDIDSLTTLIYGAIGASLVSALAAICSLMQSSRLITK